MSVGNAVKHGGNLLLWMSLLSQPPAENVVFAQWLKWFCEAGGGGSPDEARLEQTPYPFQLH